MRIDIPRRVSGRYRAAFEEMLRIFDGQRLQGERSPNKSNDLSSLFLSAFGWMHVSPCRCGRVCVRALESSDGASKLSANYRNIQSMSACIISHRKAKTDGSLAVVHDLVKLKLWAAVAAAKFKVNASVIHSKCFSMSLPWQRRSKFARNNRRRLAELIKSPLFIYTRFELYCSDK